MKAIILSVGDELVLGQTVDTNSAWLSQQLAAIGCGVLAHITVADDQPAIEQAIDEAAQRAELVLISGGIGPTPDDLTRQALAEVMGVGLEPNGVWLTRLEGVFKARGRPMPEMNEIQAMIPRGATMIENTNGTAAGIAATLGGRPSRVYVMPGVPSEMKTMFRRDVLPHLTGGGAVILSRTLHTFGLGESAVAEMLGSLMRRDRNPSVGTTVTHGIVSLRINSRFDSSEQALHEIAQTEKACRAALGDLIYGHDELTLAQAVGGLLKEHPLARPWAPAVCTAESCTGGLLAKYLTDVPGSSAYFRQGWVTYDNEAKVNQIGVAQATLDAHGAVSEPVVREMALGAQRQSGAVYAMAISGVAGPDGGTADKPVGTVCIALAHDSGVVARTFNLAGDREMVRDRAAKMALTMLRYHLLGKPMPF